MRAHPGHLPAEVRTARMNSKLLDRISLRIARVLAAELEIEVVRVTAHEKILAILIRTQPGDTAHVRIAIRAPIRDAVQALTATRIDGFLFDELEGDELVLCVFVLADPIEELA